MMAILIQPSGAMTQVEPLNGQDFSLEEMKGFMNDGWLEVCHFPVQRLRMLVDDNGHAKHLAFNPIATALYRMFTRPNDNVIVGPALLCKWDEIE
jgi:hypothetical protein